MAVQTFQLALTVFHFELQLVCNEYELLLMDDDLAYFEIQNHLLAL